VGWQFCIKSRITVPLGADFLSGWVAGASLPGINHVSLRLLFDSVVAT